MNRKTLTNGIGCLSLAGSLAFWVWFFALVLLVQVGIQHIDWLYEFDRLGIWLTLYGMGLSLALIATALGSRWWGLAAIFALASFLLAAWMVNLGQFVI
jgi:hypothetical protein